MEQLADKDSIHDVVKHLTKQTYFNFFKNRSTQASQHSSCTNRSCKASQHRSFTNRSLQGSQHSSFINRPCKASQHISFTNKSCKASQHSSSKNKSTQMVMKIIFILSCLKLTYTIINRVYLRIKFKPKESN